jgi:adenylate cyclase
MGRTFEHRIKSGDFENVENRVNSQPSKITRNQVTVLFAGPKGFKAHADTRDTEEVLRDLNEYFTIATSSIVDYGGYIDKFVGDAVIGVFESALLRTDHTERAVRAAVAMQNALRHASKNGNQLLRMVGIGISAGVVLSGHIGSHAKQEYTFIGESFKVAYSLNVMAGPGDIVMSRDVYQLIEHMVSVEPLPPRETMDRTEPWENFRLQNIVETKNDA